MARRSLKVGALKNISGEVNIAGRDIVRGYTADQVSVLLTQITSTFQPKPFDGRCPYKGLDIFEEEDAELFFGREKLIEDLLGRVKTSRAVFITGPSGSGKSSLVRAGLIHALKQGASKDLRSERWLYETMKPGRDPMGELARIASGLAGTTSAGDEILAKGVEDATILARWFEIALKDGRDKRVVLFIDQFEEVFTQIGKEEQRQAFLDLLTYAATVDNGRTTVLFAMRSDFVSDCATYPDLNALMSRQFIQVGAMQPSDLVSAIAQPALRVGLRVDPDLVAQIISDMQGEPGALPLMQFALKDLFDAENEKGGAIALTLEAYLQRGGIHKSLERHADDSFARLSENEQELARAIFSGLIEIGRGTQDTRRTALFNELVPADAKADEVGLTVQKLADARLVTTSEQAGRDTVTLSHEKLIDAWPWLKRLVNENRDSIFLQNEIASDAQEWDDHQQDASYLYRGARLANAREQMESKKLVLNELGQLFIQAGTRAHADELEAAKKRANQLRRRSVYLSVALGAALTAVGIAVFFGLQAQQRARIAKAGELAIQSVAFRTSQPDRSLLLSVEAFSTANDAQTRSVLLENIQVNPRLVSSLRGHTDAVWSMAFSPDGKTLASGSCGELDEELNCVQGEILLWDMQTRQPSGSPLHDETGEIFAVAFSPDGKTVASGSDAGVIILWDRDTHQPIGQPLKGHTGYINSIAFSPDGKTLASGGQDRVIILWDVATHQRRGQPLIGHAYAITSIAFSPDGRTLASGSMDRTIILWNVTTRQPIGQPLRGHSGSIYGMAISPNGRMIASASADKTVMLWDMDTRQPIGEPLTGNTDWVNSVAFSRDGSMLASGGADKTIILWDPDSRQPIGQPLTGYADFVNSVLFSPDGKTLASGSCAKLDDDSNCLQGEIRLWDMYPQSWVKVACQSARRNFTYEEWAQYFLNEEYRKTCEEWPNDPSYYGAIAQQVLSGSKDPQRIQKTLDKLNAAIKADPSLGNPSTEASRIVAQSVETQIENEVRAGKLEQALSLLQEARNMHLEIDDADLLNGICWDGSLQGHAVQVLQTCDEAVALAPDEADFRDSRGVARVLSGDYSGAIEDFQFFVDHTDRSKGMVEQRQQWIDNLRVGNNPFTPEVLVELLDQ